MCYKPADHAIEPRQTRAAWIIYAALLVVALGASVDDANSHGGLPHRPARSGVGGGIARVADHVAVEEPHVGRLESFLCAKSRPSRNGFLATA